MPSDQISTGPTGCRTARWVFISAGLMLVLAGTLKAAHIAHDSSASDGLLPTRSLSLAALTAEFALGVLLLSGLFPTISRVAAIAAFALLLAVSAVRSLNGETSCACFGGVAVAPWLTTALDFVFVVLLLALRPSPPDRKTLRQRAAFSSVGLFAVGVLLAWLVAQDSSSPRLMATPTTIELGPLPRGGKVETTLIVTNPTDVHVDVVGIRATCSCVSVIPGHWSLGGGEQLSLLIVLDLGHEPDFVGRLIVSIVGMSASGQTAFQTTLKAVVEP